MTDIWFHEHICQRLSNALITYNNEGNILIYMLIAFVPVYLIYRIIKLLPLTPNPYTGIFPEQSFSFNIHDKTNILAAFLVALAYTLYLFLYLSEEMSFFPYRSL